MTSKFEGWGMTLIEALQLGCVPICYETYASIRDIIESGKNGYLVQPDNAKQFKEYTYLLASDEIHRKNLMAHAMEKVEEFSMDIIIKEWLDLLK